MSKEQCSTPAQRSLTQRIYALVDGSGLISPHAVLCAIEEAEASVCPEDYGFEEWIGVLTKRDGHMAHGHLQALVSLLLQTRTPIGPMRDRKDYPSELQSALDYLHGRTMPSETGAIEALEIGNRHLVAERDQLERELAAVKAMQAASPSFDKLDCHYDGDINRCDKNCKQIGECKRRTTGVQSAVAPLMGTWAQDDPRRVFVEGAKWWQYHKNGATAFASEVDEMEREANKRIGLPSAPSATLGRSDWHDELLLRWCEWTGGHLSDQNFLGIIHDIVNDNLLTPSMRATDSRSAK